MIQNNKTIPSTRRALNQWLRRAIAAGFERYGDLAEQDRFFPVNYGAVKMVETVELDGTVRIDYQGNPVYSAYQVAEYVRKFCELNHLRT